MGSGKMTWKPILPTYPFGWAEQPEAIYITNEEYQTTVKYVPEKEHANRSPDALVLYDGDECVATFDSYAEAAAFMGVKEQTAKFMASPSHRRRKGHRWIERIYFDE